MTQDSTRRGPRPEDPLRALTRATLAASQRPGGPDCPDVEVIAAFYDGSIGTAERPMVEAHLSVCARCQSEVAAIARADESGGAANDRTQGVRWWKWMAPIAAGTLAYGVWLAVQPLSTAPPPEFRTAPSAASTPASDTAAHAPVAKQAAKTASLDEAARSQPTGMSPVPPPERLESLTRQKVIDADAAQPTSELMAFKKVRARPTIAEKDKASTAPATEPPARRQDTQAAAPATAARVAAAPPPALRDQAAANMAGAPASAREESVASSAADALSESRATGWRVERDGSLSELTPDGRTWRRTSVNTRVRLTAVSAPGRSVAWAVGDSGTVIRTIDGARWNVVQAPTSVDLRAIEASDASTATVTDIDGRKYRTTDGGVTWQPF